MKKIQVPISKLHPGFVIAEKVKSSLGNIIMQKDHNLSLPDIEVLRAFLVKHVTVDEETIPKHILNALQKEEEKDDTAVKERQSKLNNSQLLFQKKYILIVAKTKLLYEDIRREKLFSYKQVASYLYPFIAEALNHKELYIILPKLSQVKDYIYHHAVSVSILTAMLSKRAGMSKEEIYEAALAGYLHNIGLALLPQELIFNERSLTDEEFELIKQHPSLGYQTAKKVRGIPNSVLLAILQHHEREDGSGYPLGFKANKLHTFSKLIAITDMFYAMSVNRAHQTASSPYLVIEEIKANSFGKLNTMFVHYFIEIISQDLSLGKKVLLSNNQIGEIVFLDKNALTRPIVSVKNQVINLQQEKQLYILDIV